MIRAKNISFVTRKKNLLNNIGFDLQPATLTAVIGPNGAGKSTLLKILAGNITPSYGKISFDGLPLSEWNPKQLATRRAVLFQNTYIDSPFLVSEIVSMGRYPHQSLAKEQKEDAQWVNIAMEKAGVAHLSGRLISSLSGGEQQRVHFARVLAQILGEGKMQKYLLLDEPVNALDIQYQHQVLQCARDIAMEGLSIVAVLHDLNLAMQYADNVLVLNKGELVGEGKPKQTLQPKFLEDIYGIPFSLVKDSATGHTHLSAQKTNANLKSIHSLFKTASAYEESEKEQ